MPSGVRPPPTISAVTSDIDSDSNMIENIQDARDLVKSDYTHLNNYPHSVQCGLYGDMVMEAIKNTLAHFVDNPRQIPTIKRKDKLGGIRKEIELSSGVIPFFGGGYIAEIDFKIIKPDYLFPDISIRLSTPIGATSKHISGLPVKYFENSNILMTLNSEQKKKFLAGFIADIASEHQKCFNRNINDQHKIEEIALLQVNNAIEKVFAPKSAEPEQAIKNALAPPVHNSNAQIHLDLRKLATAITQSLELTVIDLASPHAKKPIVRSKLSFEDDCAKISMHTRYYRYLPLYRDTFSISFRPKMKNVSFHNALERDYGGGAGRCDGSILIPLLPEENSIAAYITDQVISAISQQIRTGLTENHGYLLKGKTIEIKSLEQTIRAHLDHKLAAAFGGELLVENPKPIKLSQMDQEASEQQFRNEMTALMKAGRTDTYLLQTFGIQASAEAGKDAGIIAEWQTGRTMQLPKTLDKIRALSETLESFIQVDFVTRALNTESLLGHIRSLQKTAHHDLQALTLDAKSIHEAKTIMKSHEIILQKYVQGFHHRRETLSETFGEAATLRREEALKTTLIATQIHTANQETIHEQLNLRMIEQISDFMTRMSFLSQSMSQIATEATIQKLLPEGKIVGDIAENILFAAGLKTSDLSAYKNMSSEELEISIIDKVQQIQAHIKPIANATIKIEYDMISNEGGTLKLLPAPFTQ